MAEQSQKLAKNALKFNDSNDEDMKFFWDVIKRYDTLYVSINTKCAVIITFNTFVLTAVSLKFSDILTPYQIFGWMYFLLFVAGSILCLATITSVLFAYLAIHPFRKTRRNTSSLIFFGDVGSHENADEFLKYYFQHKSDLLQDITNQTYHLASGLTRKFDLISHSIKALMIGLACLVFIMVSYFISWNWSLNNDNSTVSRAINFYLDQRNL